MRCGENATGVNEIPTYSCPVCRGICNCDCCRQEKDGNLLVPSVRSVDVGNSRTKNTPGLSQKKISSSISVVV